MSESSSPEVRREGGAWIVEYRDAGAETVYVTEAEVEEKFGELLYSGPRYRHLSDRDVLEKKGEIAARLAAMRRRSPQPRDA